MGFGSASIKFLMLAVFAVTMIGMFAVMDADKPTDEYYTNESNSVAGSVALGTTVFGVAGNLMVPIIGVMGILVLLAGFIVLKKRGNG